MFILLAVFLVFGQTLKHKFVNFDDHIYVYENPWVMHGLSFEGIKWAFAQAHFGNWDPLTWVSHMLDCQLYGLEAGGHHLSSVLLHGATAILLFLVLIRMTGSFWPSALVAVLFAIHPLRVESVAWVAERKDVLSGLFFVLTLGAYAEYVRRPFSLAWYLAVVITFALGLMSKPSIITLPFVLLLLDYWPLRRIGSPVDHALDTSTIQQARPDSFPIYLLVEKLPLLALAVVSCFLTLWAQRSAGGMALNESIPLLWRLCNAVVSYVVYLGQLFFPVGLTVFYPHPGFGLSVWKVAGALLILTGISVGAVYARRRHPYILVGWLWYVGMLVPVIGLVQTGSHARADRFTYLPQIGLLIAIVWGVAHLTRSWSHRSWGTGIVSALIILVLMGCAWRQTSFWRDAETLWTHTLANTSRNVVAYNGLGFFYFGQGRMDEAAREFQKALEIQPMYTEARYHLGLALASQGRVEEAIGEFQKVLAIQPTYAEVHNGLGNAFVNRGRIGEAIQQYQEAIQNKPEIVAARNNLGAALVSLGRIDEAMMQYKEALEIQPYFVDARINLGNLLMRRGQINAAIENYQKALAVAPMNAEAHCGMGVALVRRGQLDEGISHYREALKIKPDFVEAQINLGAALASRGEVDEAIEYYRKAIQGNPNSVIAYNNLGVALASQGLFAEAIQEYLKALELAPNVAQLHNNLGKALAMKGQGNEAVMHFQRALEIKPDFVEAQQNLNRVLKASQK